MNIEGLPTAALQVTPELFSIPYEDKFIVYAPLKGVALYCNASLATELGRWGDNEVCLPTVDGDTVIQPTCQIEWPPIKLLWRSRGGSAGYCLTVRAIASIIAL